MTEDLILKFKFKSNKLPESKTFLLLSLKSWGFYYNIKAIFIKLSGSSIRLSLTYGDYPIFVECKEFPGFNLIEIQIF